MTDRLTGADVRALTIRQPWASLIAAGVKTIETRSRRTSYRGPVLIHAGKALTHWGRMALSGERVIDVGGYEAVARGEWVRMHHPDGVTTTDLPLGAVVAVAELVDCRAIVDVADQRDEPLIITGWVDGGLRRWDFPGGVHRITDQLPLGVFTPGRWAWLLENVRPLATPVPAKGRLGLWRPDAAIIDRITKEADGD